MIRAGLGRLIGTLAEVRRDEVRLILPLSLAYGLVMASLYVLKPARNALFLDRLGVEQLPYVLLLVALIGGLAAAVFSRFLVVIRLNRLILSTFLLLLISLAAFWLILPYGWSWSFYLFYVWVSLYGLMTTSLLWLLAGTLFNARQARRLFGLIGTSGIAGAILGGTLTGLLVNLLGTENLLLVCMALLAACLLLLYLARADGQVPNPRESTQGALAAISGSQLLRLLVGMAGITALIAAVVDVQFNDIVNRSFPSKDQKTAFFGEFFAYLSIFAFFFQVLLTPRILRSLGVTSALLVLPLSLGLGSAAILLAPGLAAGILAKVGDGGLRHSVHKSASEILFLPLPPETKQRTKVLLDTTVDNLATGLGAFLVLLLSGLGVAYQHMSLLSLALVGVWITLVLRSRAAYVDAFRKAIEKRDIDIAEFTIDITEAATIDGLIAALDNTNPRRLVYALDMLANVRVKRLIDPVDRLLDHTEPEVRQKALHVLAAQSDPVPLGRVEALQQDADLDVRIEALHCLLRHGPGQRLERLRHGLDSPDRQVRAAAMGCIAAYGTEDEQQLIDADFVHALVQSPEADDRAQAAKIIGSLDKPQLHQYLLPLMADPVAAVVRQAIFSAGRRRDPEHLAILADHLDDRRYRLQARQALSAYGPHALETLAKRLDQVGDDLMARNNIARAFGSLPCQEAVELLWARIDQADPSLQYALLKSLSKLRQAKPDLYFAKERIDASLRRAAVDYYRILQASVFLAAETGPGARLLTRALSEKQTQELKRIFRLLGLQYSAKDMHHAYLGLAGGQPATRASALEFLDNVLERPQKEFILPLIDETPQHALAFGAQFFAESIPDAAAALEYLLHHADPWLRTCATYALGEGQDPDDPALVSALRRLADDDHPLVRETAHAVLDPDR